MLTYLVNATGQGNTTFRWALSGKHNPLTHFIVSSRGIPLLLDLSQPTSSDTNLLESSERSPARDEEAKT
jgi:hypothetical protein